METTNPVSPHEEVENENRQPVITSSPSEVFVTSSSLPVDDVSHEHEITSPEKLVDHRQPGSPLLIDDVEHNHVDSISPSLLQSPEKSVEYQPLPPPEQAPSPSAPPSPLPEEKIIDGEKPPLPPLTEAENPSSPLANQPSSPPPKHPPESKQTQSPSPSPSPSPPTAEADYPPENPKSPLSKPPSPIIAEGSPESPNSSVQLQGNPNLSFKSKQSPKYLTPSPPQDTPEPNTLTPPLGVPLLLHAAAATFSPSKPQISPWTHQETANLIQAYQEKWYSLKKGPLKAGQWEEVAITVAARCGYDEPTKTSKQCRHKIEKLRKRYRTERGKPRSKANAWNFFKLMDNLEKGPLPISSSQPMALEYHKPSNANDKKRKNDVYDDDGDHLEFVDNKRSSTSRARNSNNHVANGGLATNLRFSEGGNRIVRGLRTPVIHKRKPIYQEEPEEENNENDCEEEDVAGQLAAEIKCFAEKFIKMENKKIEMMRDVERYRLEMENKRMKMIIESQQMLVETVNNAFGSSVKTHKLSAS